MQCEVLDPCRKAKRSSRRRLLHHDGSTDRKRLLTLIRRCAVFAYRLRPTPKAEAEDRQENSPLRPTSPLDDLEDLVGDLRSDRLTSGTQPYCLKLDCALSVVASAPSVLTGAAAIAARDHAKRKSLAR